MLQSSPALAAEPPAEAVSLRDFGAAGDGSADDAAALQRALAQSMSSGQPLWIPAGRYRIGRPVVIRAGDYPAHAPTFALGPRIIGAGAGRTIFQGLANAPLFDLDSNADHRARFQGVFGSLFQGFTIAGGGDGIRLRTALNVTLRDLHILGLSGTGVEIVCLFGDNDGSNMVALEQLRVENCRGWGIDAAAAPGANEISFLHLRHVFVQGCGTASSAGAPPSGGMKWKGQVCTLDQCAFTLNENCAFYIPGEAGLAQTLDVQSTAFENNKRRQILCTGISAFKARNIQLYNNDAYPAEVGCDFEGSRNTIRFVDIDGVVVRATAGNGRYTAFRIGGTHAETGSARVRNVVWENFDYPGQTRFQGWQFEHVDQCCDLQAAAGGLTFGPVGLGNKVPLRLRGIGPAPSTSGEWTEAHIESPLVLNERLSAGRHHIYLFDDRNVKRLEASTTNPALDPASGYLVKANDASKLFVGSVETDGAGQVRVVRS